LKQNIQTGKNVGRDQNGARIRYKTLGRRSRSTTRASQCIPKKTFIFPNL